MSVSGKMKKMTLAELRRKKRVGDKITMLTAYDYPGASMADEAGMDMILVGDSLAMTVLGHPDTVSVTMDEMLHHCKAVQRGAKNAFLVGDMPFMSYHTDPNEAVKNAGRFIKEARMDAVKLEGGRNQLPAIESIVKAGIPVLGHLGLTPQTATALSGYKVQGKTAQSAKIILEDARFLQTAGCFGIVLEAIPSPLAELISAELEIPTIGIGAGNSCDGQVLVYHDLLGLFDKFTPKFVKQYAQLKPLILDAITRYAEDVKSGEFPAAEHSFSMKKEELQALLEGKLEWA
ncbi:MAG: 3-methyl-2-oxobutanoate hydroxymethyltransferase [Calditrichia bacterium]